MRLVSALALSASLGAALALASGPVLAQAVPPPDASPAEAPAPEPTPTTAAETEADAYAAPASGGLGLRDLAMMERVSDPRLSPDGRRVLYSVRTTNWDENKGDNHLWLAQTRGDPAPRRLDISEGGASSGRWAPDGNAFYFLSSRGGSNQVWRADVDGQAAAQVTRLPLGVSGFQIAPDGRSLILTVSTFADCDTLACTKDRDEAEEKRKSTVQGYDQLPLRPWDSWADGKRGTLWRQALDGSGLGQGEPTALTPSWDAAISGAAVFLRNGDLIVAAQEGGPREVFSTNTDLWRIPSGGGAPVNLTPGNPAADGSPVLSPDGRRLAWLAEARDGLSGDQAAIMIGEPDGSNARRVAADWDRGPGSLDWSEDGRSLYVTAADNGSNRLFRIDARSGQVEPVSQAGSVSGLDQRGGARVWAFETFRSSAQIWVQDRDGPRALTAHNAELLAGRDLVQPEMFTFAGWNGEPVQGWVFKPAGYVEGQTYPVVQLIHGGPKSPWTDGWSYRWNPQTYTGAGFGVVMINFHGSPGFGQAFTDSINEHWGDRPLEDLQKGWVAAIAANPWTNESRACALGASYGGYMVNRIAGRWAEPWNCLVNHAGVYDVAGLMNAMDIGWFVSEFGGPHWEKPEIYRAMNPAEDAGRWTKPMLVLHGSRDFRVPIEQGLATFSALQRQGIESRFVHVPDENHWILKPQNWADWQKEILDWTARYTGME